VTNIVTSIGDYFFFGSKSEPLVIVAFGIMLGGAILAAWNDIFITWQGLFWMAANCCSTSGYVLYMKHATNNIKLTKFGMVFVNNVLCVVFLLPISFAMGEIKLFFESNSLHTVDYASKNAFAGLIGFFLNFASLNCVQATGPTTYAIVGSLNKIPVTFLGYMLFDNKISAETWFFITVSMTGGFVYSYAKLRTSMTRK
jgi:GDP-mannose transporter